jgi:hypothetical protein
MRCNIKKADSGREGGGAESDCIQNNKRKKAIKVLDNDDMTFLSIVFPAVRD